MIGAGILARNAVQRGLTVKPWVKTSLAPGIEGRHRVSRARGADRVPRRARLQPRRLRLHDVHRQQRPAARGDLRCRRRRGSRGRLGAVGQPQLRGPDQPRREDELPGLAASVRRLRHRRDDGHRPLRRAAGRGRARPAGVPQGHLADAPPRSPRRSRRRSSRTCSARATARCSRGTSAGHSLEVPDRESRSSGTSARPTCSGRRSSRGCRAEPEPIQDIEGARVLAVLGDSVTTDHISPAGSIKRDSPAGAVPDRARGRAQGLQLLRLAPRQPRGDDAGHVREHPPAQPARPGHRGRRDRLPRRRRRRTSRCRSTTPRCATSRRASARRPGRQGVRVRLVARLGRKGHAAARRAGRDRRELRADPPLQPRRDGRAAAPVRRPGESAAVARTDRARRRSTIAGLAGGTVPRELTVTADGQELQRSTVRIDTPKEQRISATAGSCSSCCVNWRSGGAPRGNRLRRDACARAPPSPALDPGPSGHESEAAQVWREAPPSSRRRSAGITSVVVRPGGRDRQRVRHSRSWATSTRSGSTSPTSTPTDISASAGSAGGTRRCSSASASAF